MRTRGMIAALVVVLGLAAVIAVPRARTAWRDHQDRERIAAQMAQMAPVAQVLLGIEPPSGVENCGHAEWTRLNGDLCWQGAQTPGWAARSMAQELQRVGASEVLVQCWRWQDRAPSCGVKGTVAGRTWAAVATTPSVDSSAGFRLSGESFLPRRFPPPGGVPVPPEQA